MIRIKFPRRLRKAALESWCRAYGKHPDGAVSNLHGDSTGYSYTIQLP